MIDDQSTPVPGAHAAPTHPIMYEMDLVTGELTWNDLFYTELKFSQDEPADRLEWWVDHVHPEDAMIINQAMDRLDDPKMSHWIVEYRFRDGEDHYVFVSDRASIIRDRSGKPIQLIGTIAPNEAHGRGIVPDEPARLG